MSVTEERAAQGCRPDPESRGSQGCGTGDFCEDGGGGRSEDSEKVTFEWLAEGNKEGLREGHARAPGGEG